MYEINEDMTTSCSHHASFRKSKNDGLLSDYGRTFIRSGFSISGKQNPQAGQYFGNTLFATGWNKSSVILRVLHDGRWSRYLMDVHGMFYELPALVYDDKIWGIRPICTHLRIIPDFVFWRGLFVLGSPVLISSHQCSETPTSACAFHHSKDCPSAESLTSTFFPGARLIGSVGPNSVPFDK